METAAVSLAVGSHGHRALLATLQSGVTTAVVASRQGGSTGRAARLVV